MNTQKERTCFVICPIGDRHAHLGTPERVIWENSIETWEKVIQPACKELGLQPFRADHITESGEIPEQVCRNLKSSDLIVADLTGGNANVMYELGLRHTTGLPTAQIGERGRLPFDVSAIRTIIFVRTEGGLISARKELAKTLKSLLAGEGHPVTATRVWLSQEDTAPGVEHAAEAAASTQDGEEELGYLEKLAEAEIAIAELSDSVTPVVSAMEELGNVWSTAAEQVRRSDAAGGGASAKLAIAERAAKEAESAATSFQEGVDRLAEILHRMAPGMDYLLERVEEGLEDEELPHEFIDPLMALGATVESNQSMFAEFLQALSGLDATRSLKRINRRIGSEVNRFMELSEVLVGWRDRLRNALSNGTQLTH